MTLDDVDLDQRILWVLGKGRRPRGAADRPQDCLASVFHEGVVAVAWAAVGWWVRSWDESGGLLALPCELRGHPGRLAGSLA